jgi:hypothetical protein
MMPLMMTCRDQPCPQRPPPHPGREYLPAHMIGNPHNRHDRQHQAQRGDMNGNYEDQQRNHDRAGQRLAPMEAHRRPGGGWAAGMVDGVIAAEQRRHVHRPVRPVEPGVVQEQVEEHRDRQVPERPGMDIGIDARPAFRLPSPGDDAGGDAVDRRRGQAPADLHADLPALPGIEPRVAQPRRQREPCRGGDVAHADDHRHGDRGSEDGEGEVHGPCCYALPVRAAMRSRPPRPCGRFRGFNHRNFTQSPEIKF